MKTCAITIAFVLLVASVSLAGEKSAVHKAEQKSAPTQKADAHQKSPLQRVDATQKGSAVQKESAPVSWRSARRERVEARRTARAAVCVNGTCR